MVSKKADIRAAQNFVTHCYAHVDSGALAITRPLSAKSRICGKWHDRERKQASQLPRERGTSAQHGLTALYSFQMRR